MAKKETFYVTTPIYYPSDNLHIGHAYCSVAADTLARFKKLTGHDVYFLTGTDEHGQKIEQRAGQAGVSPQQFVDHIVSGIKELWKIMDVSYDDFLRTTEKRHETAVQRIFKKLYDQGDIYKGEYEGLYCTPCEAHWTQTQAKDGKCPDCGRPVQLIREESYFFKMSKYQDWLIDYIETHPEFIQPVSRANEMLNNFLRPGLQDLCVSRSSFKWGVPIDFDPEHVIYVWIDALSNYITALGYGSEDESLYQKYWPANIQLVGKEIIRFHTIYWPILLKALGLPLPKQIYGHGWLIFDGQKMGKSIGNVVDPVLLCDRYGSDAIRYFLLREMPLGSDGNFTNTALLSRMNADLSNDLGNLVSRTTAMIEKYFGGLLPACEEITPLSQALRDTALALPEKVEKQMDALQLSGALSEIWKLVGDCNRYIDATTPWILAKNEADRPKLASLLYHLAECARFIAVLIGPFMPKTPGKIFEQIGAAEGLLQTEGSPQTSDSPRTEDSLQANQQSWESLSAFGALKPGAAIQKGGALFPRFDIEKELEELALASGQPLKQSKEASDPQLPQGDAVASKAKETTTGQPSPSEMPVSGNAMNKAANHQFPLCETAASNHEANALVPKPVIAIDDFAKIQLKVAKVVACERVKKSDKLLHLTLQAGQEQRTVLSGIAEYYKPEEMIGKRVVLLYNLAPRKMRGIESQGMILAAEDNGILRLLTVDGDLADGSDVS